MAIAHDNDSGSGITDGDISSISWAHTISSASNPILFVSVSLDFGFKNSSLFVSGAVLDPSGQNVAFTPVTANLADTGVADNLLWFGYVKGSSVLTAGSHTIQVNTSISTGGDATHAMLGAVATSFTGVDQTTPIDAGPITAQGNGTGTTLSVSVTTVTANAWVVDGIDWQGGTALPNSPQVNGANGLLTTQNSAAPGLSYNGPIVSPGATADGWTNGGTMYCSMSAIALKPFSNPLTNAVLNLIGIGG